MKRPPTWRWRATAINLGAVVALLAAASLLPPDPSLADRRASGVLKLCVPQSFPPLVTDDAGRPGYDIELARKIADALGLRLLVNTLPSIGSDYNPRNWSLTRAQCDLVGGGVADSVQTRNFLQTVPTQARTGWIGVSRTGTLPPAGGTVAVLPGASGLDRVALSTWLRQQGLRGQLSRGPDELASALSSGRVDAAITERFLAAGLEPALRGFRPFWIEGPGIAPLRMAFGLWKGDQTLKRAVTQALARLRRSGDLDALSRVYGVDADLGSSGS